LNNSWLLIGSGGHAVSLWSIVRGEIRDLVVVDPDASRRTRYASYFKPSAWLNSDAEAKRRCNEFSNAIVGVGLINGSTRVRSQLFSEFQTTGIPMPAVQHPSAVVDQTAKTGAGCQIFAHATVNPESQLGQNVVINTGAIVEHECLVEDHAFVAPGAILCGQVTVGRGAIIGAGAVCLPGSVIPEHSIVKAGTRFGS